MKDSFYTISIFSFIALFAVVGFTITGDVVRTKVYYPSYDVAYISKKVLTPQNLQIIQQDLGIDPDQASEVLEEELSKSTCYNSDGSFDDEANFRGFTIDRSGNIVVDKCTSTGTDGLFVLREAYCRKGFISIRTILCNCRDGECFK